MTDNCSTARKTQRLFVGVIDGTVFILHCQDHMRNTWAKRVQYDLSEGLREMISDNVVLDPKLRLCTSYIAFLRALDKDLNGLCEYAKGQGKDHAEFVRKLVKEEDPHLLL